MTTILYFFWSGFSASAPGATMTGPWVNVMHLHAGTKLELHAGQQLQLETGELLELRNG